jgi:hypothetical protein
MVMEGRHGRGVRQQVARKENLARPEKVISSFGKLPPAALSCSPPTAGTTLCTGSRCRCAWGGHARR